MKKLIVLLALVMLPLVAKAADSAPQKNDTNLPAPPVKSGQQSVAAPKSDQAAPASAKPLQSTSTQPAQPLPDLNRTVPQGPLSLLATPQAEPGPKVVQVKVGAVDVGRISTESSMGKAAEARIRQLQSKLQKQVEAKKSQVEAFKADIERQMPALAPQQREAKAREFQKKVEEFQKFAMESEKELMLLKEKLSKEMLGALEKVSVEFGDTSKLTAIFVKRELIYVANGVEALDITDQIIRIMNEKYPAKIAPEKKETVEHKKKTKKKK